MTTSTLTVSFQDDIFSPDEEAILGPGALVEIDDEMLFISSFDMSTSTLTFPARGHSGSTPAAHAIGDYLRFPSRWPRYLQLKALQDAVDGLFPPLFVTKEARVPTDTIGYLDLELNTVEVHRVQLQSNDRRGFDAWYDIEAEAFPTAPLDSGVAYLRLETNAPSAQAIVGYGIRIVVPATTSETIVDLPQKWERLVLVDSALSLMSGVDIDAVTQEYLTQSLRLERFPVRSAESITRSLIAYREYLVDRFLAEQKSLTPPMVIRGDVVYLD
jgi:hypothetical protein